MDRSHCWLNSVHIEYNKQLKDLSRYDAEMETDAQFPNSTGEEHYIFEQ